MNPKEIFQTKYEDCNGCMSLRSDYTTCSALGVRYRKCPCKNCLVKGICQARCQELEDFESYLYQITPTTKEVVDKKFLKVS